MTWKLYRHKNRPEIKLWARDISGEFSTGYRFEIRAPRMCGETEDRSPERSQPMGIMPAEFAEIYEEVG